MKPENLNQPENTKNTAKNQIANEQPVKNEKEEIWAVEEEIEEILDPESGHELAGILPANHPRWQKLLAEGLADNTPLKRKKEILQIIKETAIKKKFHLDEASIKIKLYRPNSDEKNEEILAHIENVFKNRHKILRDLELSKSFADGFLGNGSTSEVYVIASLKNFCVKIIVNQKNYNELDYSGQRRHNYLDKEGEILTKLSDFIVDDVKTPTPLYWLSTPQFEGLAMWRIKAVNLARVFEGHERLPGNFDLDNYFEKLKNYFQALHNKMEIIHGDVAVRNLMVDEKTGQPWVIDFGRARTKQELWGTGKDFDQMAKNEIEMLNNLKYEVKEKLKKINFKKEDKV